MKNNSEIIKIEILRVINENGKIRGTELVKRVTKSVGSEKIVYREISKLVESGEIEKKIHSKDHIEYDLVNLQESANNQLKKIFKELKIFFDEMQNFDAMSKEKEIFFQERLRIVIHFIHTIQSLDGIMKILSFYPTFKKDKMFSQINRKINDCWELIMSIIVHQEDEFLNQILSNMRVLQLTSKNLN